MGAEHPHRRRYDACATTWPPWITTGSTTAGENAAGGPLSAITRSDGVTAGPVRGAPVVLLHRGHRARTDQRSGQRRAMVDRWTGRPTHLGRCPVVPDDVGYHLLTRVDRGVGGAPGPGRPSRRARHASATLSPLGPKLLFSATAGSTVSSSPTHTVVDQFDEDEFPDVPKAPAALLAALKAVPDPRKPWGLRHQLRGILAIAGCAVIAGARSFVAIAEWAAAATPAVLAKLGVTGVIRPRACGVRREGTRTR
jgi:hypothetical protein